MKKLMIAFSILSAGALIACADNSVKPNYDAQSWFGAKVTDGEIDQDRGQFTKSGESTYTVSDGKIEIDSELKAPVSFVLNVNTDSLTSNLARVTFELDPAVVPYSSLPEKTDLTNVKVAFALCENEENSETVTNFYAWAEGKWNQLDFAIPTETYTLTMTFDQSTPSEKKVQFSIGSVTSKEFTYTTALDKPQIDFVGSGKITQLAADQLKLLSAEIDFTGGSVKIAGEDMDAMKKLITEGETIETALVKPVKEKVTGIDPYCGLTVAEAYAIGLIAKVGKEMAAKADGTFKVKADATAKVDGGIKVAFVDSLTPNDQTAKITYGLEGSKNGTDWDKFDDITVINSANIVIPTDKVTTDGYRYFKVVTKVDLSKLK